MVHKWNENQYGVHRNYEILITDLLIQVTQRCRRNNYIRWHIKTNQSKPRLNMETKTNHVEENHIIYNHSAEGQFDTLFRLHMKFITYYKFWECQHYYSTVEITLLKDFLTWSRQNLAIRRALWHLDLLVFLCQCNICWHPTIIRRICMIWRHLSFCRAKIWISSERLMVCRGRQFFLPPLDLRGHIDSKATSFA